MGPRDAIHVLVIDDSAVVRQALRHLIASEPDLTVSLAADAIIADKKMKQRRPDVVILDLELPHVDGMTWLRQQMSTDPLPIIVCSASAGDSAVATLRALEEGALEVVPKPTLGVREFLLASHAALIHSIRAAAQAHAGRCRPRSPRAPSRPVPLPCGSPGRGASREADEARTDPGVIALAASTGGPQAIQEILAAMPRDCPPILVVQHMSGAFTGAFARRLDSLCAIDVREARSGEALRGGTALIAPGGRHLELVRQRADASAPPLVRLHGGPQVHGHRPSADVLFRAVARTYARDALGVLLTGMGRDGADGLLALRQAGGRTFAESEESCVVFGMPRAARDIGAVDLTLPLAEMAGRIASWILEPARTDPARATASPRRRGAT